MPQPPAPLPPRPADAWAALDISLVKVLEYLGYAEKTDPLLRACLRSEVLKMSFPDPKVLIMRLVPATVLLVATAAVAKLGVNYSATATSVCRMIAAKPGTAQKIGQLFSCSPDAPKSVLVAAAEPVVTTAPATTPAPVAPARMPLGMNLAGVTYYASEHPFLNRAHASGAWTLADPWIAYQGKFDANGYPAEPIPGEFGAAMGVEDPVLGQPHRWVLTWDGTAHISRTLGGWRQSAAPRRVVFDVTDAGTFAVTPLWAGGTVTNVKLVRADQEGLLAKGEIFNPAFLARSSSWSLLRFMDWGGTNGSGPVNWASRPVESSVSWGTVPIEVMVKLANQTHADMWYNVPAQADDAYVRSALTLIRDMLDPSLKVHVEYSNEPWNWAFPVAKTLERRAADLWGVDANKDGVIDVGTRAETLEAGNMVYYGYRAAQIAKIARDVFGAAAPARLRMVLGSQTVWADLTTYYTLPGIARAQLGTPASLFNEYAVTTYFGWDTNATSIAKMLGWARGGAAGLDAVFSELEVGGTLPGGNLSLAAQVGFYAAQSKIAKANGLALVAYEGGLHATAYALGEPDKTDMLNFIKRIQADPRMAKLLVKMANDFAAAGGTELTYFNDAGPWDQWGSWGLTDSTYQTSARYEALKAIAR